MPEEYISKQHNPNVCVCVWVGGGGRLCVPGVPTLSPFLGIVHSPSNWGGPGFQEENI